MSIAVVKAYDAYPLTKDNESNLEINARRLGYQQGYDQAMQDFLKKACEWLEPTFKSIAGYNCGGDLMNDFKNYMENESEN